VQSLAQPSPSAVPPSSHSSPCVTTPSPHASVATAARQPLPTAAVTAASQNVPTSYSARSSLYAISPPPANVCAPPS